MLEPCFASSCGHDRFTRFGTHPAGGDQGGCRSDWERSCLALRPTAASYSSRFRRGAGGDHAMTRHSPTIFPAPVGNRDQRAAYRQPARSDWPSASAGVQRRSNRRAFASRSPRPSWSSTRLSRRRRFALGIPRRSADRRSPAPCRRRNRRTACHRPHGLGAW
jgi:hypothetical protein